MFEFELHNDPNLVHAHGCDLCDNQRGLKYVRALLELPFKDLDGNENLVDFHKMSYRRPDANDKLGIGTHCDHLICHAPKECSFCDEYSPIQQKLREIWNVNFTGQHMPSKLLCPSEKRRPIDLINKWSGNTPK